MQAGQIIALDLGQRKTGLARASTYARLPEPLTTLATEEVLPTLSKMDDLAAVVVGLPRNMKGEDTEQTRWVRAWAGPAKAALPGIAFYWQDEALTSKLSGGGEHKTSEDARAAAIILQDFLNSNEADRSAI
ncbi:MAG TPA: RuvX/YqgF family protein [Candidatus Saccharimonadales bacterium]|nr:RuvX/YqgF family protein [Candidatus Saccharimonadales bacterium]